MKIIDLLTKGSEKLKKSHIESPFFEAEYLLGFTLDKDRLYVKTHLDDDFSEEYVEKYMKSIDLRCRDYPSAYITGRKEFFGLDFFVEEGVLIPRPETELLVETVLEHVKTDEPVIADVGTGSGAIAIALAKNLPNSHIYALDISKKALKTARENARFHGVDKQITFMESDYLSEIIDKKFDVIASNPPYIKTSDIETLQKGVRDFEPLIALDGGEDGLDAYKTLLPNALDLLNENGIIVFEIGFDQKDHMMKMAKKYNLKISVFKDICENYRTVLIEK